MSNYAPNDYSHHLAITITSTLGAVCALIIIVNMATIQTASATPSGNQRHTISAATPIRHLVVIFDENESFDHYFGTYPHATNTDGIPFHAKPDTPAVNGLTKALLRHNPNGMNPKRLTPTEAFTCDMDHEYKAEQKAFDRGLMDAFPKDTGNHCHHPHAYWAPGLVMDYYDGNTVTALWNYAQRFAMSDNNYGSQFGPSSIGAFNLVEGRTALVYAVNPKTGKRVPLPSRIGSVNPKTGLGTLYSDQVPRFDDCSSGSGPQVVATGNNIGVLLSQAHVSWGWFQGGFVPTSRTASGKAICGARHENVVGVKHSDYEPHWDAFQYYAPTSNPHHLPPRSLANIGRAGPANHNYGLRYFYKALRHGDLPAVSYVKAPAYETGHPDISDPLDEQYFLVNVINAVQRSRYWQHTAIIVTYDDSDGWYDQAMSPIVNPSHDPKLDALSGPGQCGHGKPLGGFEDRCGYGPRLPLLVISPYGKTNYVSHFITDQTSILRFIEDNWLHGKRLGEGSYDALASKLTDLFNFHGPAHLHPLFLDPCTGQVLHGPYATQTAARYRKSSGKHLCHWPIQVGQHKVSG